MAEDNNNYAAFGDRPGSNFSMHESQVKLEEDLAPIKEEDWIKKEPFDDEKSSIYAAQNERKLSCSRKEAKGKSKEENPREDRSVSFEALGKLYLKVHEAEELYTARIKDHRNAANSLDDAEALEGGMPALVADAQFRLDRAKVSAIAAKKEEEAATVYLARRRDIADRAARLTLEKRLTYANSEFNMILGEETVTTAKRDLEAAIEAMKNKGYKSSDPSSNVAGEKRKVESLDSDPLAEDVVSKKRMPESED